MTFDEALAELGIEGDVEPDQARRAYLRLLKIRKPETDPQGFMRLREAYDLIKPGLEWRAVVLRTRAAPEPPAVLAPTVIAEPGPDQGAEPPAPARDEEAAATPEPPSDAAHDGEEREDEEREDEEHDDEPLEAAPANVDALLAAGEHEQAARALARIFEHALERSEDAAPAVRKALPLMLTLYASSSAEAAAALGASLFAYLRASGQEARAIRGADAARWTILRELAALSPSFPNAVRAPLAQAAMAGDLGEARSALTALQRRRPGPAAEAALLLRTRAPVMAAAVADALDPPARRAARRPFSAPSPTGRSGWAFGVLAIGLVRVLVFLGSGATTPSYQAPRSTSPSYDPVALAALLDGGLRSPPGRTSLGALRERALHRADRVKAHADYALGSDGARGPVDYEAVSKSADLVSKAIARGDCPAARARLRAIEAPFGTDGGTSADEIGRVEAWTLDQALTLYCKALDDSHAGGATPP